MLAALSRTELVEMDRSFQNALCCGGGAGNVFTGLIGGGADSAARARVREAFATGARVLAVACPHCAVMFEDAVKTEKLEDKLVIKEVSEFIRENRRTRDGKRL
jgi:Fe-S oxidoreductase